MQETHSEKNIETIWENEWGGKAIFSHGTSAARGIAVFMSKTNYQQVKNIYTDTAGRLIIFDFQADDKEITFVAIYAPNEDSPVFFKSILELLENRQEHKIIIGDFNLTLDVELDRLNTYCNNNKAKEEVENIMDKYFLMDIWRTRNEEKKEFSWRKKNSNPTKASRIDLALVSKGLDQMVEMTQYLSSIMTDHRALYLCVITTPFERGTGYWKMNTQLLHKQEYVDMMRAEIEKPIEATHQKNPSRKWEKLKTRIKQATVAFSRRNAAEDKLVISQLSEKVNEYESNLPLNREEDEMLERTKTELEEKTLERIRGVMFRSKAKWYEEGEKNSKYFFSLEKAKYNAKTCYKLISTDGTEVSNPKEILKTQKEFYENLYDIDQDVNFNMNNTSGVYVPDNIKQQQEKQITIQDLQQAIKSMAKEKTPGEDGIPVDFYKVFWINIKEVFMEMVLHVYQQDKLHPSARKGILNLIPKPNKDSRLIKNLRPITLLNTDYKIIEKAIANKMIPALEHIINPDQRGFMKDRRISVNIRKMLDIIHQAEKQDLEAVVLSLDFVKCFDKCSFSILHGSLDFFQFGKIIKEWTHILYRDFSVKVQNNGHFSSQISIKKGVHQGGCCSSVYFLVIAEILAIALRENKDIEGININTIRNLLNQFADDMDIFSMCTEKSLKAIMQQLQNFRQQSGFTVSYDKTTIYRIGSLRHSNARLYNIDELTWSCQDITVLGVTIAHEDILAKNYEQIVEKPKQS